MKIDLIQPEAGMQYRMFRMDFLCFDFFSSVSHEANRNTEPQGVTGELWFPLSRQHRPPTPLMYLLWMPFYMWCKNMISSDWDFRSSAGAYEHRKRSVMNALSTMKYYPHSTVLVRRLGVDGVKYRVPIGKGWTSFFCSRFITIS